MPDTFGKRLRTLRKKAGLNQDEFADLLGLSYMTVRRWETGRVTPRLEEIKALAKALGVPEADLLNEQPPPPSQPGDWTIRIDIKDSFTMEVIDLNGNIQPIAQIVATPDGLAFTIKAPWDMLTPSAASKSGLEKLFKRILKEQYSALRSNGVALGGIPKDEQKEGNLCWPFSFSLTLFVSPSPLSRKLIRTNGCSCFRHHRARRLRLPARLLGRQGFMVRNFVPLLSAL